MGRIIPSQAICYHHISVAERHHPGDDDDVYPWSDVKDVGLGTASTFFNVSLTFFFLLQPVVQAVPSTSTVPVTFDNFMTRTKDPALEKCQLQARPKGSANWKDDGEVQVQIFHSHGLATRSGS